MTTRVARTDRSSTAPDYRGADCDRTRREGSQANDRNDVRGGTSDGEASPVGASEKHVGDNREDNQG
jgi:hypothetical protein